MRTIFVSIAFITFFTTNSCKKEDSDLKQNTTDLITNAKQAFINQIVVNQTLQLLSSNSKKSFRHGLAKSPDWKNAVVKTLSKLNAVMVPIAYEKDVFLKLGDTKNSYQSLKTLSYLLIYDDKEKAKTIEWVTLIPDNVSESNKKIKFTGKVIIEDWAGNFKKGYLFNKEGKIFNLIIKNENSGGPKIQSNDVKVNDVYCVSTPWYEQGLYTNENGDLVGSGYRIGGYDTNCYDTGRSYEDDYTNPSDETDGNQGETFPPDYVEIVPVYRDVVNNLNNADANCIYTRLKNNSTFQNLVNNFQNNANLSVTFQMGSPVDKNGNPVAGQTSHILGTTNFTITIDNNFLAQYGGIEVATTFLHEAFHANLYTQAQLWYPSDLPTNFQNWSLVEQIKYIDDRSGNIAGFSNSYQHNYIATHLDDLAVAIQAYTLANYPTIYNNPNATFDSYRAMAYGGLSGTQCYTNYITSLPNGQASFNASYQELIKLAGENKCP